MVTKRFSGRFLLRLPPELHAELHRDAAAAGLSLNAYCERKLAAPSPLVDEEDAVAAVRQALRVGGEHLAGVVLFGSWARNEAGPASDVDLLLVLEGVAVTRELYRRWDATPLTWREHSVEPHFVALPSADARPSALWAEAAIDGLVLFERGFRISRRLAAVRRAIAEGRLQRRQVDGQTYWVEAA